MPMSAVASPSTTYLSATAYEPYPRVTILPITQDSEYVLGIASPRARRPPAGGWKHQSDQRVGSQWTKFTLPEATNHSSTGCQRMTCEASSPLSLFLKHCVMLGVYYVSQHEAHIARIATGSRANPTSTYPGWLLE